jgi:HTH-type transcriptional regulator/antitoxin HipB
MTSIDYFTSQARSRRLGIPSVHYRTGRRARQTERLIFGTPVDHPAVHQLRAEAQHLDDERQARKPRPRTPPPHAA